MAGGLYLFVFCLLQILHVVQVVLNAALFEVPDNIFWRDRNSLFFAIAAVTVGPLIEELFFRKFLLGIVLKKSPIPVALCISSILFSVAHVDNYSNPPLEVFGLIFSHVVLGIGLGILYLTTRKLLYSIIAHVIYNFFILTPKPSILYATGIINGNGSFLTAIPYFIVLVGAVFYLLKLSEKCKALRA
ncbi:CPBP family intramembrane glutamic endopeptidase [Collimonas silvisoli]|uniref:CPBP family intramembrane glutamic endopeptidase n=1 Tax=Collimonas silvisoli TaxID=2825884 RepID=UPI001B8CBA02|nr:CPBP family intramembrane glutamic endopeptidase [Collimonas silvisoli]